MSHTFLILLAPWPPLYTACLLYSTGTITPSLYPIPSLFYWYHYLLFIPHTGSILLVPLPALYTAYLLYSTATITYSFLSKRSLSYWYHCLLSISHTFYILLVPLSATYYTYAISSGTSTWLLYLIRSLFYEYSYQAYLSDTLFVLQVPLHTPLQAPALYLIHLIPFVLQAPLLAMFKCQRLFYKYPYHLSQSGTFCSTGKGPLPVLSIGCILSSVGTHIYSRYMHPYILSLSNLTDTFCSTGTLTTYLNPVRSVLQVPLPAVSIWYILFNRLLLSLQTHLYTLSICPL